MQPNYKQTKNTKNEVEYMVTIPFVRFEKQKDIVFEKLASEVQLPGFRPGKGPKAVIEEKLGTKLFTEALNELIPEVTYEIIVKEKLNPITAPNYDVKTVDPAKGIEYSFSFVSYPEVKLGDFSKISIKKGEVSVSDSEIEEIIRNIVRSTLKPEELKKLESKKSNVEKSETSKAPKHKKEDKNKKTTSKKQEEEKLQDFELTDELIAKLGYEEEKTLSSLKASVRKKLTEMKNEQLENEYNSKVISKALELSTFEIPDMLLEQEVANLEADFTSRLKELSIQPDEYLKSQGTSLEEKRKEWEKIAQERIGSDLVLIKIASTHDLLASEKDVDDEVEKITDENIKKQYQNKKARDYVKTVITKQRGALKLIEMVKKSSKK